MKQGSPAWDKVQKSIARRRKLAETKRKKALQAIRLDAAKRIVADLICKPEFEFLWLPPISRATWDDPLDERP